MVGPGGCGKTQILRAVGGDTKSIGVFATGSDFLTAWKGEAEKNPKRLFLECVRLQQTTGKHVHILIDEIDALLAKPDGKEGFGGTNLTTEFQNLMDGVVAYRGISVWGATNYPERIPMPMIRRFAKVLIVGELTAADRAKLLEQYMSFMPLLGFREGHWKEFAERTEGAVGDNLRKICDHVWREKMTIFTRDKPEDAHKALAWLRGDGGSFNPRDLDPARRAAFLDMLRPHVRVEPADLNASISRHLENPAVHTEIETAKATYKRARELLANIRRSESSIILVG
jgi:SpoVK/Ycf46/Vps4 family AAA+-type ATPase